MTVSTALRRCDSLLLALGAAGCLSTLGEAVEPAR